MPDAQSRRFYIVRELQIADKLSAKVAGNYLLLSVTGRSVRCRSGSEISGAGLYERQGAERRSRSVEGCGIRDELIAFEIVGCLLGILLLGSQQKEQSTPSSQSRHLSFGKNSSLQTHCFAHF